MTDATNAFVSVIVPAFNDAGRLRCCLEALDAQTYPKPLYEVIVVDNGSDDAGAQEVAARFPLARFAVEPRPGSYAARNTGLALARGDVLAFTDSDCAPAPDWIERGVAALSRTPNCGLVAGRVEVFCEDARRPTAVELYEGVTALAQRTYVERGRFGATANLFTTRAVFERTGPFDDSVMSGGDVEWGQRVARLGYAVVYADDARVSHPARRTLAHLYRRVARVTGGFYALTRAGKCEYISLGRGFLADALPPLRASLKVLRAGPPQKFVDRLKVVGVMFFVQYAQALELLRLKAGGRPRR